jgi:hypothetical protein
VRAYGAYAQAMGTHHTEPHVQLYGCACLRSAVGKYDRSLIEGSCAGSIHCDAVAEAGGVQLLVTALRLHSSCPMVRTHASPFLARVW